MLFERKHLHIVDTDITVDGVIITFSDGQSVLFHTHFLRQVQKQDGNIAIASFKVEDRQD